MSRLPGIQGLEARRSHRIYQEAERRSLVAEFERRRAAGESVRAIARALDVSEKNYYNYSSRSTQATVVAATFYTLIESAKLTGVDPRAYLLAT